MGKVAKTTNPALPATCVMCNKSANGVTEFADFNASLDYYGAIVFCEDCIRECLMLFDCVPQERHDRVLRVLAETRTKLEETLAKLKKYEDVVVNLDVVRPDLQLVTTNDTD